MFNESVYTLEEVAQQLQVPVHSLEAEIAEGRLAAMQIAGGIVRVRESQLNRFIDEAEARRATGKNGAPATTSSVQLCAAPDFTHTWPDGKKEIFTGALEGVAPHGGRTFEIKLGFTTRRSAGQLRRRSLVLVDRYATVEFVAPDAKLGTGKMASIIKDRFGKQLPGRGAVPPEYKGLVVGPYRDVVDGPGASNGLAVVCSSDDFEAMVRHALIRSQYREERPKK